MLSRARSPRRALAQVFVLVAAAAVSVSSLAPATALPLAPNGHRTAQASVAAQLTLAPVQPVLLSNDEFMEFELWLENPDSVELAPGVATLSVDPVRVTDAAALNEEAAEPATDEALTLAEVETPAVAAGEGRLVTFTVPRDEWPLTTASDAGVYRVFADVTLAGGSNSLTAGTPIVWRGAGGLTDVAVTAVAPITLPAAIPSLPRRGQLNELFGPESQADALLTLAEERGATLAVDPRVIAGVRAYGESASPASREFIDRLVSTKAPSFALQFADADPSAQSALGFTRLLAPEGLSFATRYGTFAAPETPSPLTDSAETDAAESDKDESDTAESGSVESDTTESDTTETDPTDITPDVAGTPSLSQLTTWDASLPGTAWPAAGTITPSVIELLTQNRYSRVLASADNVTIAGGGARGTASGVEYLVSDSAVDAAALHALSADTDTGLHSGIAHVSALLALRAQAKVPGLVLTLDRRETAQSPHAVQLLDTILGLPWVTPTAPEALPQSTAALVPAAETAAPERVDALAEAVAREPLIREYSRVLVSPKNMIDLQRVRLLQLLSARYTRPGGDFEAAAEQSSVRDAETLDGLQVVTSTHTQLIGATSRVPVQVRNSLPFDALLTATVTPTSAALAVSEPVSEATLIPGESNINILVPVRTRVSSGESGLAVSLYAATGGDVVAVGDLDISIRSSWELLALGVLGALTAAFFGFGIWRSIRHRRTGRVAGNTDTVEGAAGIPEP